LAPSISPTGIQAATAAEPRSIGLADAAVPGDPGPPAEPEPVEEDGESLRTAEPAPVLPRVRFVTAHGVGVRTVADGAWRNTVLIPRNSPVPVEVTRRFVTAAQGRRGTHIRIVVTQGDTEDIELAEVVGQGRIEGFPRGEPSGQPVDVIMEFDDTGRLHLRAVYCKTGQQLRLDLEVPNGLRAEEVERQRELLNNTPFLTVFRGDDDDLPPHESDEHDFILSDP
jgi:hypothetical protein